MTKVHWEKWPLLFGATLAIFFSVRLYQDGKSENLVAAAVLLCMASVMLGAFLVMVAMDFIMFRRRELDLEEDQAKRDPPRQRRGRYD